jgi:glutathione synthase
MKLAVLMDPLDHLKPYKDTTLAMIHSANQRGWSCVYFTCSDLFCREGEVFARVQEISIGDVKTSHWAKTKDLGDKALSEFDIVLMRKDPPFNLEYIYTTYALDLLEQQGVLVANKPQSLRDANEKWFTMHFPQCCPDTFISKDIQRLRDFWKQHQNVIYKPLEGMGGNSVFHVDASGKNLSVILEVLTQGETKTTMAQTYIPDIVETGDKRILLINGEPVPYALARIPAVGELRGNLAAGATGKVCALTERDYWICEQIAPTLRAKGLYFVGIDVIGNYLTEVNVTSPTCACEIMAETGIDITGDFLSCLELKVKAVG